MLKLVKTFIEILFLLVLLGYGALLYCFQLAPLDNPVNQNIRTGFIRQLWLRQAFFLNKTGDNRFVYASSATPAILVEVDAAVGNLPDPQLSVWLAQMIFDTVGKTVEVKTDAPFTPPALDNDAALVDLAESLKDHSPAAGQDYLHLVYLPHYPPAPTNSGLVLRHDTIYIFKETLNQLSERSNIIARLEQSTLMHEWGHLLGLDHLDRENCIMSETVEVFGNNKFQAANIPLEHCPETLQQLRQLKKGL